MAYKDKPFTELFSKTKEKSRNPQADPQENFLHPPEKGPKKQKMSEDVKELEPVKDNTIFK